MMKYHIRSIKQADAEAIYHIRIHPKILPFTLGLPSETLLQQEERITNQLKTTHQYVAVLSQDEHETVVGWVGLFVEPNPRKNHVAGIGLMVHPQYHGYGIGQTLLKAVLDLADQWLLLKRLELTVHPENKPALHLYKKYGFEIEGLQKKAYKANGQYTDAVFMGRIRSSNHEEGMDTHTTKFITEQNE